MTQWNINITNIKYLSPFPGKLVQSCNHRYLLFLSFDKSEDAFFCTRTICRERNNKR